MFFEGEATPPAESKKTKGPSMKKIFKNRVGAAVIEYALLMFTGGVVAFVAVSFLAEEVHKTFELAEEVHKTFERDITAQMCYMPDGGSIEVDQTPSTEFDCYDPENVGKLGVPGSECECMLIVDNTALFSAAGPYSGEVVNAGLVPLNSPNPRTGLIPGDISFAYNESDYYVGENWQVGSYSFTFEEDGYDIFTGQITDMGSIFSQTSYNGDIGYWNTSNVENLSNTFAGNTDFNQDIGAWDVSKISHFDGTFGGTTFNRDISGWDVSGAKSMPNMFGSSEFNQDIGAWDVSQVQDMTAMFSSSSFNQDIGALDVSQVQHMALMFQGAYEFNQDLSGWCFSGADESYSLDYGELEVPPSIVYGFFSAGATEFEYEDHPRWEDCP